MWLHNETVRNSYRFDTNEKEFTRINLLRMIAFIAADLEEAELIDPFVRHWVKNVPYIIVRTGIKTVTEDNIEKTWRSYGRLYVLTTDVNGFSKGNLLTSDASIFDEKCDAVLRYFQFDSTMSDLASIERQIRMNGVRIVLPKMTRKSRTVLDLYEFLDIPSFDRANMTITSEKGWHAVLSPPRGTEALKEGYGEGFRLNATLNLLSYVFSRPDVDGCLLRIPISGMGMDHFYGSKSLVFVRTGGIPLFNMNIEQVGDKTISFASYSNFYAPYAYAANVCMTTKERWMVMYTGWTAKIGAHANVLLIDKHRREVYLFDPHGEGIYHQDAIVHDTLAGIGLPTAIYGWRVRARSDWCPRRGGQHLENRKYDAIVEGFCSVWSVWIIELLMKYPDVELSVLHKRALQNISVRYDGDVSQFIGEYAQRLKGLTGYTAKSVETDPKVDRSLLTTLIEHPTGKEFSLYELDSSSDEAKERSWRALVFASRGRCFFYRQWSMAYALKGFGKVKIGPSVFETLAPLTFGASYDIAKQTFSTPLPEEERQYYKIFSMLPDRWRRRLFPNVIVD